MTGSRSAGNKSQSRSPVYGGLLRLRPTHCRPQGLGAFHHGPRHWQPCGIMPQLPLARRMLRKLSAGLHSSQPKRPRATVDDYIHRSTPALAISSHRNNPRHHGASRTSTRAGTHLTGWPGSAIEHPP